MKRVGLFAAAFVCLLLLAPQEGIASLTGAGRGTKYQRHGPPKWMELEGYTFHHYVRDFGRSYKEGSTEWQHRQKIFEENLKEIQSHNKRLDATFKKGVNQFSDLSAAEFREYNKFKASPNRPAPLGTLSFPLVGDTPPMPRVVDHRRNSPPILTAVKNQGGCGDCWSHAATEQMESYFALLTGQLPVLSQQQMTSCTDMAFGCGGGDPILGWMYVNQSHGLTSDWVYPFVDIFAKNMSKAATSKCKNVTDMIPDNFCCTATLTNVGVDGYTFVESNNATAAVHALATVGPLAGQVAAHSNWQHYESGILMNNNSSPHEWEIDHSIQMVGYGFDHDNGLGYWIIRNSWGTLWGEEGFIRLFKTANPADEPCDKAGLTCGTSGCLSSLQFPVVKQLPIRQPA